MVVRAFDEAVAFRYVFYSFENEDSLVIRNERMDINPVGNPKITALPLPSFINSHEGLYTTGTLDKFGENGILDMPVTFELPGHIIMSITEANLRDYAGMYLVRKGNLGFRHGSISKNTVLYQIIRTSRRGECFSLVRIPEI